MISMKLFQSYLEKLHDFKFIQNIRELYFLIKKLRWRKHFSKKLVNVLNLFT